MCVCVRARLRDRKRDSEKVVTMNLCSLEMEINFHMVAFKGFGRRIIYKCVCFRCAFLLVFVALDVYMCTNHLIVCISVIVCGLLCA